jgi:putative transposase
LESGLGADATVAALDKVVGRRGTHPEFVRCDNGPELTANALHDWCRFTGAGTGYVDPGSPWQNPWVESYGGRMRDQLLAVEQFDSLLEAQVLVADWRTEYNTYRPHSALGMLTPIEFAERWRGQPTAALIAGGPMMGAWSAPRRAACPEVTPVANWGAKHHERL